MGELSAGVAIVVGRCGAWWWSGTGGGVEAVVCRLGEGERDGERGNFRLSITTHGYGTGNVSETAQSRAFFVFNFKLVHTWD